MSRVGPHVALLVCSLALFISPSTPAEVPSRDIALGPEQVDDVFFAYVMGVLLTDSAMDVGGDTLLSMFPEFRDGGGQVPFDEIERVSRTPGDDAHVVLELKNPLDYPVPVDILGYHPGTVLSTQRLVFAEERYRPATPDIETVRLEWLESGKLGIDFVNWLDLLLGNWVDDVDTRVLAAAEYQESWYVVLAGDTPDGGWIAGVYDLQKSRIVVRPPRALRELGRELEQRASDRQ